MCLLKCVKGLVWVGSGYLVFKECYHEHLNQDIICDFLAINMQAVVSIVF